MYGKYALGFVAALAIGATTAAAQTITVGGKNFTEQQLLTEMTAQLLTAKGFEVDKRAGMGSAVVREAMESGQIDVYWEYVGTSLIVYNKVEEQLSPEDAYTRVRKMDAEKGIAWLTPSAANNTYALAMRKADAAEHDIHSISDLAEKLEAGEEMNIAVNAEFYARPDGLQPLQAAYGFEFPRDKIERMDTGLTYQALRDEQVDVGLVFATDGRIPAFDFEVLEDDKGFFPSYALTPVVRQETLDAHPELVDVLNSLSAKLDDATMARLNAQVDVERKSVEGVAATFLKEQGLI